MGWHILLEEVSPDATPIVYTVSVAIADGNNRFYLDGVDRPTLTIVGGRLYRFDLSHFTNTGQEFRWSLTSDGHHGGGSPYLDGVLVVGTAGSAGAFVQILATNTTQTLYYHCHAHGAMGVTANNTESTYLSYNTFLALEDAHKDLGSTDLSRIILDIPDNKVPDITKHYTTSEAPSDLQRWTPFNQARDQISTWIDTVVTSTYGMQPFRPHFASQWPFLDTGMFDDVKFT